MHNNFKNILATLEKNSSLMVAINGQKKIKNEKSLMFHTDTPTKQKSLLILNPEIKYGIPIPIYLIIKYLL